MAKNSIILKSIVLTVFAVTLATATVFFLRPQYVGLRAGKADENYIKSVDCLACHENHFESWEKTHHSKMTQIASEQTVQGDFVENNSFEYLGIKAKMQRRGNEFFMTFNYPDGRTENHLIKMTVGSRRIEQYVTEKDGKHIRLPIAWHIEQKRWMSLNGSFFYPDSNNFNQHTTQWDTNCVFCHNVKAQPNLNFQTLKAKTEVSEYGIACGACHGQGAEHAEMFSSPLARSFVPENKKIVHPEKINSDRSLMICGHCHGQRIPQPESRIQEIMTKGDPFNAGEDLSKFYQPVHQNTKIGNLSFAPRFWADGSLRLTAYEYQGILRSPCFVKSKSGGNEASGKKINCLSCHSMHEGDVKGQITEEKRTNLACTQCHSEFETEKALVEHTKHLPASNGSSCYSCHMPEVVYGVMSFHKTHEISNPNPQLTAQKNVPNACNQCHLDKSVNWSIEQTKKFWSGFADTQISEDKQFDIPEGIRGLFAGDALTRAMMADALSRRANSEWFAPYLAESFSRENYPIVRYFAANGLLATTWNLPKPDYLAEKNLRDQQIQRWFEKIDSVKREEAKKMAEELLKYRQETDLEVGE